MSMKGSEEGKLLKRKDFLGVDEEARTHPNRTYYYRKSSDLQKIIETCTRKLEDDPHNAKALFLRGNALLKLRDYHSAIKDISAYLSVDAENEAALYSRGIAWSKIGQPDKAIADMSRVLQLNPNHVNAAFARAACYNAIGQFTKAIEDYNFALLKDEAGGGMRSSGGAHSIDRSGAGTPVGIEVTHSFSHDDSRSPLPWMTSPLSRSRSHQDMSGPEGPVDINSAMGNLSVPSPVPHGHESESNMPLSHRLSTAIRPLSATPAVVGINTKNTMNGTSYDSRSRASSESSSVMAVDQRGTPASPEKKETAEREYALGYQCRKQGDFKRAVVHYTNAIEANPKSFKAVFNRGFAYDKLEDFERAIRDYSAAAAIEPDNAFAYYNRGITHDRSGDLTASSNDFAKAISIQPNNVDFLHNYGNCLRKMDKYEEAAAVYQKAIHLSPKGAGFKAHFNRGVCLEKLERMSEALVEYNEALAQQPKHTQSLINRANVLCALGKLDPCMSDLDAAGQKNNLSVQQKTCMAAIRANMLEKTGNLPEALREIERALALEGSSRPQQGADATLLLSTRANIYKSMEDYNKAINDLTVALRLNPPNPSTCHSIRGLCWRKLGNFEEALNDYGKCIEHHMTMYNAMSNVDSNATLETRQLGARHYNNRAYCYAKVGRFSEAIGDYTAAIHLDPMNSHAYHNRGTSYDKLGQGDLAIADFTKVLELDTDDGQTVSSVRSGPSHTEKVGIGGTDFTLATDFQYNNNMTRSPSHTASKNPISPDRSISTIGDNSVNAAAAAYNGANRSRHPSKISASGYYSSENGSQQSRRDAPRAYGATPIGNVDHLGKNTVYPGMHASGTRDSGFDQRPSTSGIENRQGPVSQSVPQNKPQSKYHNWNAARVNTALESAAKLAAAPVDSNIRIRSGSPNFVHRDQRARQSGNPFASPMTQEGTRNIQSTKGQRNGFGGGTDRRPGSAPPMRPEIYREGIATGVNSAQRTSSRAASPTSGPRGTGSAWRQNININSRTGIAIGGGIYGDGRSYVSPASHSPINGLSQQGVMRPSPADSINRSSVSGRTSPMRSSTTRPQPASSRSQSPRIPVRGAPPNLGLREASPFGRDSSSYEERHRSSNNDIHVSTGDSNNVIQPPVVARGRFSNWNR